MFQYLLMKESNDPFHFLNTYDHYRICFQRKIQLNKYKSILEEMNFKVAEKILIYVNEKIKIYKSK